MCIRTKHLYLIMQELKFNHLRDVKLFQLRSKFIKENSNEIIGSL